MDILQQELIATGVLHDFEAHKELVPIQLGDMTVTFADTTPLEENFDFKPNTPLRECLRKFAWWNKGFIKCDSLALIRCYFGQ